MGALTELAARPVQVRVARPRLVAGGAVLSFLAVLLVLRLHAPGWPMDEGAILAYADRILGGQVPGRDLHPFYGPLGSYLVAGAFKLFGASTEVERAVGIAYRLVLCAAAFTLVRRRGAPAVLAAGVLLFLLLPQTGDAAFALYGAVAFSLVALALADTGLPLLAGLAAGVALLFRFDWALPLALASIPWLAAWPWRRRVRLLAGALVGAAAYAPYLVVLGSARIQLWVHQLSSGQGERHLPLPHWSSDVGRLLLLAVLAILGCAVAGWRRRCSTEGVMLMSVALLAAGTLPYALNRADRAHVLVAAIVPVALLPALGFTRRSAACAMAAALAVAVVAQGTSGLLALDVVSASVDDSGSHLVRHGGRSFPLASRVAAANATRAVALADRIAPPGGSVFVGPRDLRTTSYADSYIYFLLPRLRPATFYITLDPGSTNAPSVRLASELGSASVLVLNTAYDTRGPHGTAASNRVVARRFCTAGSFGTFRVLRRCR